VENEKKQPRLRKPRITGVHVVPDGHETKRNPNGLRAAFRAIRQFWDSKDDSARSMEEFSKLFENVCTKISSHYGGDFGGEISSYLSNMEADQKYIRFFEIRMYSEFLGIPTGLLLLYSQLISDEANLMINNSRGFSTKEHLSELIEKSINSLNHLKETVLEYDPAKKNSFFVEMQKDKKSYDAKIEGLSRIVSRFNAT
jgi:hypothetical protein